MKSNTYFDINRFTRLIAHDLKLNGTGYLLKLSAFTLLLYIWILTQMRQSPGQFMWTNTQGYMSTFIFGFITLGIFIGTSFSGLENKINRTSFLLLPASNIEKFLQPFLLRVVLGTGLFFLLFWMDAQLARLTFHSIPFGEITQHYSNGILLKPEAFDYSMIFSEKRTWLPLIFAVFSTVAFFFACPLFFRKVSLLKSIFVFFAAIFFVVCLFVLFSHLFYPDQVRGFNVHLNDVWITQKLNSIELAAYALVYLSWPFFLVIGFFRLKEATL